MGPRPRRRGRERHGAQVAGPAPSRTTRRQPRGAGPGLTAVTGAVGARSGRLAPRRRRGPHTRPRPAREPRARPGRAGGVDDGPPGPRRLAARDQRAGHLGQGPGRRRRPLPPGTSRRRSHADDAAGPSLHLALRAAGQQPGRPADGLRRPSGVAARVRRRDLSGPPGGVRRRLRASGELPTPLQEAASQRRLRRVGPPVRPRTRAGDDQARPAGVPARHLRAATLRPRADRPARASVGLANGPGAASRSACAGVRQPGRGAGDLGARPAGGRRGRSGPRRGGPRTDAGRPAGGVVAAVRDAGLRAPCDRLDVRRGRHRPDVAVDGRRDRARCGSSAPGGPASAAATTPPRSRRSSRPTASR